MKWLKRRRRDQRGKELRHLVPEMKKYVSERYEPRVQYSIASPGIEDIIPEEPKIRYSLPAKPGTQFSFPEIPHEEKPKPVITNMKSFVQEAKKDMALYDSPAMENTYRSWEKKNAEKKSFSSEVMRMVKQKYIKPSDFYRPAGIDKRTFHKIKTDYGYKPSKKTAIRCCIGLHLNGEQAERLLRLAGYAFSRSEPDDLVVLFCLEHEIWDIPGINYMLYTQANGSLDD